MRTVRNIKQRRCPVCKGTRKVRKPGLMKMVCDTCQGMGVIPHFELEQKTEMLPFQGHNSLIPPYPIDVTEDKLNNKEESIILKRGRPKKDGKRARISST